MKPELPLRDTVPMATASRAPAAASSPFHLLLCASVHKSGAENLLGGWRGAGDQVPSQGCKKSWEIRGFLPGELWGEPAWGHSRAMTPHCSPTFCSGRC